MQQLAEAMRDLPCAVWAAQKAMAALIAAIPSELPEPLVIDSAAWTGRSS